MTSRERRVLSGTRRAMTFETLAMSQHATTDGELSGGLVNGADDQKDEDDGRSLEEPLFENGEGDSEAGSSNAELLEQLKKHQMRSP